MYSELIVNELIWGMDKFTALNPDLQNVGLFEVQ